MELPAINAESGHVSLEMDINFKKAFAGDTIKGEVIVKPRVILEDCSLTVEFIAKEWCKIDKMDANDKEVEQTHELAPPQTIHGIKGTTCKPGSAYNTEYKFKVPDYAPASFDAEYPGARGYVRYLVMAVFKAKGYIDVVQWKKIKVKEKFPAEDKLKQNAEGTVSGYCYSSKGRLRMACAVESLATITKVDSNIDGNLDVDNRGCPFKIKFLESKISQVVYFHAGVKSSIKEDLVVAWKLPEVRGSEQVQVPFKVDVPYNEKFKTLATSRKGHLLKREYKMTIGPEYDTYVCCAPSIDITFAIENLKLHKKKDHK